MINANVFWEGPQLAQHSLALVNREICLRIRNSLDLTLFPFGKESPGLFAGRQELFKLAELYNRKKDIDADIVIRHQWPPRFTFPKSGYWVMMQPWEFGPIPKEWVRPMSDYVDEIWAYSHYVKQCYIDSGIPAGKVTVISLGVDQAIFHPKAPVYSLQTKKKFKFLFVGGTIWRKGIDCLLDVYVNTFSSSDDVCLVIKDMGGSSFYKGINAADRIRNILQDSSAPEIEYIPDMLSDADVAGLYTACDCLVHPYRGEGFGLPVAEAMASGLAVIVSAGGPTDDFCPDEMVYKIRSERMPVNIEMELAGQGWVLQPDERELARLMNLVIDKPEQVREKAIRAFGHITSNFTWDKCAEKVLLRIQKIKESNVVPLRMRSVNTSTSAAPKKDFQELEELFKQGTVCFKEENYSEALKVFSVVLEHRPKNVQASQFCAESAIRTGNDVRALEILTDAVKTNPNNADLHNLLGIFLAQRNEPVEAALMFKKAVFLAPDDPGPLSNLVEICLELKEYEEVLGYCDKMLETWPDNSSITLAKGKALALTGRLKESLTLYKDVLKRGPSNIEIIENIKIMEEAINKSLSESG